jgi:hypothetical protein
MVVVHIAEDVGTVSCRQFRIGSEAIESSERSTLPGASCGLERCSDRVPAGIRLGPPSIFAVGSGLGLLLLCVSVAGDRRLEALLGLASICPDFFCWRRGELFRPRGIFLRLFARLGRAPCEQTSSSAGLIDHVTHDGVGYGRISCDNHVSIDGGFGCQKFLRGFLCTSSAFFRPGQVAVQGSTKRFSKWRFISEIARDSCLYRHGRQTQIEWDRP